MKRFRVLTFTLVISVTVFFSMAFYNLGEPCFYIANDGNPTINCASSNCGCCLQWTLPDNCIYTGSASDFCACY